MASNRIAEYLKYANFQMAAEAFLQDLDISSSASNMQSRLVIGNNHASKFPQLLAEQVAQDWVVVNQRANTPQIGGGTGFSGTLFRSRNPGVDGNYDYAMSIRSTEFLDDSLRDNQATNTLELKEKGWAFGQTADMEKWYADLKAQGSADAGAGRLRAEYEVAE